MRPDVCIEDRFPWSYSELKEFPAVFAFLPSLFPLVSHRSANSRL
jgi:hypothetical protein